MGKREATQDTDAARPGKTDPPSPSVVGSARFYTGRPPGTSSVILSKAKNLSSHFLLFLALALSTVSLASSSGTVGSPAHPEPRRRVILSLSKDGHESAPHKISLLSVSSAPDPFSPNGDGRKDESILTVQGLVRPTNGLKAQGDNGKEFFFRTDIRISDPASGSVVRTVSAVTPLLCKEEDLNSFPPLCKGRSGGVEPCRPSVCTPKEVPITAHLTFNGLSASGSRLPDATYPYCVSTSYIRIDAKSHVKVIDETEGDCSLSGTLAIDTTPPDFLTLSPEDGFVSPVPSVQIVGTLSEASSLTINGQVVLDCEIPSPPVGEGEGGGSLECVTDFSETFPLAPGENTFTLLAEDAAGNQATRTLHIIFDNIPPTITISRPLDLSYISNNRPPVEVIYSDPAPSSGLELSTLSILLDGDTVIPAPDQSPGQAPAGIQPCSYSFDLPSSPSHDCMFTFDMTTSLSEGPHTITASISDRASNRGDAEAVSFTVDTIPPVLTVDAPPPACAVPQNSPSPPAGGEGGGEGVCLTNHPSLLVRGSVSEPATVRINGMPVDLTSGAAGNVAVAFGFPQPSITFDPGGQPYAYDFGPGGPCTGPSNSGTDAGATTGQCNTGEMSRYFRDVSGGPEPFLPGNFAVVREENGRLRMEANFENLADSQTSHASVVTVDRFPEQDFSADVDVLIDPSSMGSYQVSLTFGVVGAQGWGSLICALLPAITSGPQPVGAEPVALVSTCSSAVFGGIGDSYSGTQVPVDKLIGRMLQLRIAFSKSARTFTTKVADQATGEVLFEATNGPVGSFGAFELILGVNAGAPLDAFLPVAGHVLSFWDNFESSLTTPSGYLALPSCLAADGQPYCDMPFQGGAGPQGMVYVAFTPSGVQGVPVVGGPTPVPVDGVL